jgi:hypothetical protein
MLRLICMVCICMTTLPAFCEPAAKWEVATIIDVKTHQIDSSSTPDVASYDVSVKIGNTVYLVLYTPPLAMSTIKYAGGRQLLVLVGKKSIRYNDILGQSLEVPIISQKPAADVKQTN